MGNPLLSSLHGIPLQHYILLSGILFSIGVLGVLYRRNAIILFMSIELMLNAVNLLLAAFSTFRSEPNGQVFVFFIMAVAAAEVASRTMAEVEQLVSNPSVLPPRHLIAFSIAKRHVLVRLTREKVSPSRHKLCSNECMMELIPVSPRKQSRTTMF